MIVAATGPYWTTKIMTRHRGDAPEGSDEPAGLQKDTAHSALPEQREDFVGIRGGRIIEHISKAMTSHAGTGVAVFNTRSRGATPMVHSPALSRSHRDDRIFALSRVARQ
ncbi:MAG: hypothetical protein QOI13_1069 [Paraburkholderia sp.]|jgi:hypothetical protein|nr:hypothetical protein [Paraburkholderia sp.]